MRYTTTIRSLSLCLMAVLVFKVSKGFGMGGAVPKPNPSPTTGVPFAIPTPVRNVVLTPVITKAFPLPGGTQVDLTSQLQQLLVTATTQTDSLAPQDPNSAANPCDSHIELRAAVTSIEMAILELGLTVGYTPTQTYSSIVSGATGSLDVQIGSVGMDFSLWSCASGECSAVNASHADQSTTSATLSFQVDFGTITTGEQLVYNTPFGTVLQKILQSGVNLLASSAQINQLPWFAVVQQYDPSTGSIIFNAGAQSRIGANQAFTVFAASQSGGVCGVYQAIANVHTTTVTAVSSTAVIDQSLASAVPQVGDVVMVNVSSGSN